MWLDVEEGLRLLEAFEGRAEESLTRAELAQVRDGRRRIRSALATLERLGVRIAAAG